jgi:hypothetical protein
MTRPRRRTSLALLALPLAVLGLWALVVLGPDLDREEHDHRPVGDGPGHDEWPEVGLEPWPGGGTPAPSARAVPDLPQV